MILNKKFTSVLIILLLILVSCKTDNSVSSSSKSKTDAFAKIDKKSKKLFTKDDRINNYKKSVSQSENLKKSLNKNTNYSGYGSVNNSNKDILKDESNKELTQNKKSKTKYKYNKSNKTNVYSAYSTN